MRNILLLATLIILGCQSHEKYDSEKIIFNIRKYLVAEDLINLNLEDNSQIKIDSIREYPKYKYLESELKINKAVYNQIFTGKDEVNKNLQLIIVQNTIDSITEVYNKTEKTDNYFKTYITIKSKLDREITESRTLMLSENFMVIGQVY